MTLPRCSNSECECNESGRVAWPCRVVAVATALGMALVGGAVIYTIGRAAGWWN